jgi:hypothetical protein
MVMRKEMKIMVANNCMFQEGDTAYIELRVSPLWKRALSAAWKFLFPKHWLKHNSLKVLAVSLTRNEITVGRE